MQYKPTPRSAAHCAYGAEVWRNGAYRLVDQLEQDPRGEAYVEEVLAVADEGDGDCDEAKEHEYHKLQVVVRTERIVHLRPEGISPSPFSRLPKPREA